MDGNDALQKAIALLDEWVQELGKYYVGEEYLPGTDDYRILREKTVKLIAAARPSVSPRYLHFFHTKRIAREDGMAAMFSIRENYIQADRYGWTVTIDLAPPDGWVKAMMELKSLAIDAVSSYEMTDSKEPSAAWDKDKQDWVRIASLAMNA